MSKHSHSPMSKRNKREKEKSIYVKHRTLGKQRSPALSNSKVQNFCMCINTHTHRRECVCVCTYCCVCARHRSLQN